MHAWQATARAALELQWFTADLITYTMGKCDAPYWLWDLNDQHGKLSLLVTGRSSQLTLAWLSWSTHCTLDTVVSLLFFLSWTMYKLISKKLNYLHRVHCVLVRVPYKLLCAVGCMQFVVYRMWCSVQCTVIFVPCCTDCAVKFKRVMWHLPTTGFVLDPATHFGFLCYKSAMLASHNRSAFQVYLKGFCRCFFKDFSQGNNNKCWCLPTNSLHFF